MTEPIGKETKIPPIPWAYTEDEKMEMFSIHTAGQDPVDCDNRFLVCGIWYQSSGREQGKAIADFIIDSVNTVWAEKIKQQEDVIRELTSSLVYIVKTLGALTLPQDEPEALAYYEALKAIEKAKSLTTKDK